MPEYSYTAKSLNGETVTGILVAKDPRELSQSLKNEGLFLIEAAVRNKKKAREFSFSFSSRVSSAEKILLTRNLSVMVATGLSLVSSFEVLAAQSKNKKLKKALLTVREQINKGISLAEALSQYPDIFSDFFLSMTKVGEESGTLEDVLKILALQIEKEHKLKSAVQGAMIYPAIVLTLMIFVGYVVALVVLPKLKDFFGAMNAKIPFYTKMLIDFGQFATEQWLLLIISPIVLILAVWMSLKTKTGKRLMDTLLLKIPVISPLVKESNCAILIRSLSSLLGSGVHLTRSLEVAAGTVGNFYFKKAVNESLEKIKKGEKLSKALSAYKDIFPFGAIEMLQVGEETGKTSSVLKTLANFYEDEVSAATAKISSVIEPVLIIILGAAVAFFAFSIIQPMYSSLSIIQ